MPIAPAWLSSEAQEVWSDVASVLSEASVLTIMDTTALAVLCETYARWRTAIALVEEDGLLSQSQERMLRQHPAVAIGNAAQKELRALFAEFGMTPASRSRVQVSKSKPEKNSFSDL